MQLHQWSTGYILGGGRPGEPLWDKCLLLHWLSLDLCRHRTEEMEIGSWNTSRIHLLTPCSASHLSPLPIPPCREGGGSHRKVPHWALLLLELALSTDMVLQLGKGQSSDRKPSMNLNSTFLVCSYPESGLHNLHDCHLKSSMFQRFIQ